MTVFSTGVSPSNSIQQGFRESLSGKLDRQVQEAIAGEVLEFLHSKSSRPLVQKLFVVAECVLYDAMADGARLGLAGADGPELMVRSPAGVGINFSFWQVPGNRYDLLPLRGGASVSVGGDAALGVGVTW